MTLSGFFGSDEIFRPDEITPEMIDRMHRGADDDLIFGSAFAPGAGEVRHTEPVAPWPWAPPPPQPK